jgi:hypothetical protein
MLTCAQLDPPGDDLVARQHPGGEHAAEPMLVWKQIDDISCMYNQRKRPRPSLLLKAGPGLGAVPAITPALSWHVGSLRALIMFVRPTTSTRWSLLTPTGAHPDRNAILLVPRCWGSPNGVLLCLFELFAPLHDQLKVLQHQPHRTAARVPIGLSKRRKMAFDTRQGSRCNIFTRDARCRGLCGHNSTSGHKTVMI